MADLQVLGAQSLDGLAGFSKDFIAVVETSIHINKYYDEGKEEVDSYAKKFKKILSSFNKKYPGLKLSLRASTEELALVITFKEKDLKTFYEYSASRIQGLKSAGLSRFGEVEAGSGMKLAALLQSAKKKLFLTYLDPESGSSSFFVEKKRGSIELHSDAKDIASRHTPEFKLCSYYALRAKPKKSIDILSDLNSLSFVTVMKEEEEDEMRSRFMPFSRE